MKCEIIKRKGRWYWRIVAGNNKVLCHSETYTRRNDCQRAAELVCATGGEIPIYVVAG